MPGRNYKKKPITDKLRKCALPSCSKPFPPSKEDMHYCCRKHGEKHWRETHPRVYKYNNTKPCEPVVECAASGTRRDRPDRWKKYMVKNPGYFEVIANGKSIEQVAAEVFG